MPIDLNQEGHDLEVDKEVTVESPMQPDEETQVTSLVDQTESLLSGMDVRADQMLDESNLITIAEGPTMAEIEGRLREQAEKEIERQKEIFVKKLAEQKARLNEQQKQLEQVLAGFTVQSRPLAAPTAVQASVKVPTAYHIPKLAAPPASTQVTQPGVSKGVLVVQGLQRDPSIDGGIPDIYTPKEVKRFRDSGRTDDQIKRLGRRKIAQKANRVKKRESQDVIEISDDEGEQMESTTSTDSKFVALTTLSTDSTNSKTKTMPTSQMPGTSSSTSQAQLTAVTAKVPSKSTM
uniref:Uncharacterized protein n=1 Tax=Romanomermis culicivorax TaxID=13658 RepID=A0A915IVZ5_ROMCU